MAAQEQMMQNMSVPYGFNNVQPMENGQEIRVPEPQYAYLQVLDANTNNMANVAMDNQNASVQMEADQNVDVHNMSNRTTDILAFAIQTEIENAQHAQDSNVTLVTPPTSPSNASYTQQHPQQSSNTPPSLITPPSSPPELPKVTVNFINQAKLDHFMDMEL